MPSAAEAKTLLLALMPPGAARWMNFESGTVANMWTAIAQSVKALGYDYLDLLRSELRGLSMTYRLPDWEAILGIPVNESRTNVARRAEVISRRRENGASTIPNILASVAPIAPATSVSILEHRRGALDNLIAGSFGALSVAAGFTGSATCVLHDNAPASAAGLRFKYTFTSGTSGQFSVAITSPGGITKTWQTQIVADSAEHILYGAEFAGCEINGTWSINIDNSIGGAAAANLSAGNAILIEGIGRAASGADGIGARIFEWSLAIDESLTLSAVYDRDVLCAKVGRWNPAHCDAGIALWQTDGSLTCISDNTNAIADMCVAGA